MARKSTYRRQGHKERDVPLNTSARRALQAYLDEREETGTQDPVFLSDTGAALSVRSIQSLISELARRAHLTRIPVSAHTTRPTFALGYLKQHGDNRMEVPVCYGRPRLVILPGNRLPAFLDSVDACAPKRTAIAVFLGNSTSLPREMTVE